MDTASPRTIIISPRPPPRALQRDIDELDVYRARAREDSKTRGEYPMGEDDYAGDVAPMDIDTMLRAALKNSAGLVTYVDYGVSPVMHNMERAAERARVRIERRRIGPNP